VTYAKKYGWKALVAGSGAIAALLAQRAIEVPWRALRGTPAPKVPADRSRPWTDAIIWAVATGIGVGVARLLAIRATAAVWEATVHEPPPEPKLVKESAA
jgi:hypothetical protein